MVDPHPEAEADDIDADQPVDIGVDNVGARAVGGVISSEPQSEREQQLATLEVRRRVDELARMHPGDLPVELVPAGQHRESERRLLEQSGESDWHALLRQLVHVIVGIAYGATIQNGLDIP